MNNEELQENYIYACMKYAFDNGGITNYVEFEGSVCRLTRNKKINRRIRYWQHSSVKPTDDHLRTYSLNDLARVKHLYEISLKASKGELIVCHTNDSSLIRNVAKVGALQWCLTDRYLKIFIDGEWRSIDYRIGGRNLDLPISNAIW